MIEELQETWEAEDAAGQAKGVEITPAAQTPADHIEPELSDDDEDDDEEGDDRAREGGPWETEDDEEIESESEEEYAGTRLSRESMEDHRAEQDEESEVVDALPLIEEEEHTEYLMIDPESGDTKEISEFAYETLKVIHAVTPP